MGTAGQCPPWGSVLKPATPGRALLASPVLAAPLWSPASLPPDSKSQEEGSDWSVNFGQEARSRQQPRTIFRGGRRWAHFQQRKGGPHSS